MMFYFDFFRDSSIEVINTLYLSTFHSQNGVRPSNYDFGGEYFFPLQIPWLSTEYFQLRDQTLTEIFHLDCLHELASTIQEDLATEKLDKIHCESTNAYGTKEGIPK